jgi:hypothetical protein
MTPDAPVPFPIPRDDVEAELNEIVRTTYTSGAHFALLTGQHPETRRFYFGCCGWNNDYTRFDIAGSWMTAVEIVAMVRVIHPLTKAAVRENRCGDPACPVHGDGGLLDQSDRRDRMRGDEAYRNLINERFPMFGEEL